MIRLAIFGNPVARSLSPVIHPQFAAQFGLSLSYDRIESGIEDFAGRANEFAQSGGTGCNITAPLKQAAFDICHEVSPAAGQAQAVNTMVFRGPQDWYGTNTDGAGLLRDLQRLIPTGLQGSRILLVGAGGAAAGIVGPLLQLAPASLLIANRSPEKALQLCQRFAGLGPVTSCTLDALTGHPAFDLIINATSLGHQGMAPQLPAGCFGPDSFCYDLNYGKAAQPWQALCVSQDLTFSDGLGMLVEQAALSFELWTGRTPETIEVLMSLRQQLAS
ncbi:MAG TPA: shikimate dehydrogenase [Xanthomonadales bacterium]|nr:shikimate dehydrogenase [Xanthomonadales bacterium]